MKVRTDANAHAEHELAVQALERLTDCAPHAAISLGANTHGQLCHSPRHPNLRPLLAWHRTSSCEKQSAQKTKETLGKPESNAPFEQKKKEKENFGADKLLPPELNERCDSIPWCARLMKRKREGKRRTVCQDPDKCSIISKQTYTY